MSELRTVVLSGELGRKFGRTHRFAIGSAAEAVRALCANFPGFEQWMKDSEARGVGYRVIAAGRDTKLDQLHDPTGQASIRIVPVVAGAKSGLWQILGGIALIAVSFIPGLNVAVWSGMGALGSMTWAGMAFGMGAALALGGVSQMLAPQPKSQNGKTSASYGFSGPVNTLAQGNPVPVGYGRLTVGSAIISAGITVDQIPTTETGVTDLYATVSFNGVDYTIDVEWGAAGQAIGYDVFVSGLANQPLPRTNGTSIMWTVPNEGPWTVTVKCVEQDGSYGPSATCVSGDAGSATYNGTVGNPTKASILGTIVSREAAAGPQGMIGKGN